MTADHLILTINSGVATITLNRPQVLNAIDDAMRVDLIAMLDTQARDPAVRALVITGAGRAFCSGGDVAGMKARLTAPAGEVAFNGWSRQQRTHQAVGALHAFPKPTIAAVNGAAAGLGCDIALCCDFIVASDQAMLTMSYIHRGLIPDGGGLYWLPRRVGIARAKELIFSGRKVMPNEALAMGMIDRISPADQLLTDACAWASELGAGSATSLALAKSILDRSYELSAEEVFALGSQAQAICYTTADHRASVEAFLAKSDKPR